MMMRRNVEAMQRAAERRSVEDTAERLVNRVPTLKTLQLKIEEKALDRPGVGVVYTRHVVVDRAPALFNVPCCERNCEGGGHDLTGAVLRELVKGRTHFEGRDRCEGRSGDMECPFELFFVCEATYG